MASDWLKANISNFDFDVTSTRALFPPSLLRTQNKINGGHTVGDERARRRRADTHGAKRPVARRTILVSCAQATRCVLVLVNTRAHAAPNMGVSARPQKISPGRQHAVVLLYYFPRTRPEV